MQGSRLRSRRKRGDRCGADQDCAAALSLAGVLRDSLMEPGLCGRLDGYSNAEMVDFMLISLGYSCDSTVRAQSAP